MYVFSTAAAIHAVRPPQSIVAENEGRTPYLRVYQSNSHMGENGLMGEGQTVAPRPLSIGRQIKPANQEQWSPQRAEWGSKQC